MLRDPKVRGLATEFAGNWLDFRRFEEHNAVDRTRFPTFTNELRQAMFEEPVRYIVDIAQRDRSVLDLLYGTDTFVNLPLAKHYQMDVRPRGADDWVQVEDADRYGRGGLLPMAVFLTKNAPGLRTSPVKRGYWVVRRAARRADSAAPAHRARTAEGRGELGRANAARGPGPPPRQRRAVRAVIAASMPSAWPSRVSAPSASAARRTSAAAPFRRSPRFPTGRSATA